MTAARAVTNDAPAVQVDREYRGGYLQLYGHNSPLRNVAFSADGFTTVPGRRYRVERTGSLNGVPSWIPVPGAANVSAVGGQTEVIDAGGAHQPQQFYRVRLLP